MLAIAHYHVALLTQSAELMPSTAFCMHVWLLRERLPQRESTSRTHKFPIDERLPQNEVPLAPIAGLLQQIVSLLTLDESSRFNWQVFEATNWLTLNRSAGAIMTPGMTAPPEGAAVLLVAFIMGGDAIYPVTCRYYAIFKELNSWSMSC